MEQSAPIRVMALPWMRTLPMALPEQLGEGLDRDLVNKGLQRLIACDGVGAVVMFGSRARGDWDGLSDTDLLVVSNTKAEAEAWADRLLDSGIAQDVIGMDRDAWVQLPHHPSVIWRHVARDSMALLESDQ